MILYSENKNSPAMDVLQTSGSKVFHKRLPIICSFILFIAIVGLYGKFETKSLPLKRSSETILHSKHVVPNIVHYMWFGGKRLWEFHHMLSALSAYKKIKPNVIFLHCDHEPYGKWWNYTLEQIPVLNLVYVVPPTQIFKNAINRVEHKSDIYRYQVLQEHGGIYLDTDVIVVKSFDELRKYDFTLGLEKPFHLGNGVMVSAKQAKFMSIWYDTYKSFSDFEYNIHSVIIPYILSLRYPNFIHIEKETINYPDWSPHGLDLLYNKRYDWRKNYCIHMWYRLKQQDYSPDFIKNLNSTFGEIARYIFFDVLPEHYGNDV